MFPKHQHVRGDSCLYCTSPWESNFGFFSSIQYRSHVLWFTKMFIRHAISVFRLFLAGLVNTTSEFCFSNTSHHGLTSQLPVHFFRSFAWLHLSHRPHILQHRLSQPFKIPATYLLGHHMPRSTSTMLFTAVNSYTTFFSARARAAPQTRGRCK